MVGRMAAWRLIDSTTSKRAAVAHEPTLQPCAPRTCKECPFRNDSLRGWLGPWKASNDIVEHVLNEHDFACHMTTSEEAEERGTLPRRCTGSVMFANKNVKLFADPVLRAE